MTADKDKPSRGLGAAVAIVILLVVVVLPLLYFLSVGPLEAYYRHREAPDFLVGMYWPIRLLAEKSPAFGRLLSWYIHLWID